MHCVLWSASLPFPVRIPSWRSPRDSVWWFPQCPTHLQRLFLTSWAGSWFFLSHNRFLVLSSRGILSILCRQLLINTCTFSMMIVVVLHVSALYNRTVLKFGMKFQTLILTNSCFELQILQLKESRPCFTKPSIHICIRSSLYIDDAAQAHKNFHLFQSVSQPVTT